MKNWCIAALISTFSAVPAAGEEVDSTALIFDDRVIHAYELQLAPEDWADSLDYYKLNGETYMKATLTYKIPAGGSVILEDVGVRYKGNSTYTYAVEANSPKKSFKIHVDEFSDSPRKLFGCERINLNNCILDPSMMREKISYDIIRAYLPAVPRVAYATLTVNGKPLGLYAQVEQVDKDFLERHFDKPDGNLYKASDHGAPLDYRGDNTNEYKALYELKTNKDADDWTRLKSMLSKLNSTPAEQFLPVAGNILELDFCIRQLAWSMLLSNFDSYTGSGRNYYLYDDPKSGRFIFIPWDLNLSFGQYTNGWDVITNNSFAIENLASRPLNRRILEDPVLKSIYSVYLQEMMTDGPASPAKIAEAADGLKALIDPLVQVEPEDCRFYTYEQFLTNIDSNVVIKSGLNQTVIYGIKNFPLLRYPEITSQIQAGIRSVPRRAMRGAGSVLENRYSAASSTVTIRYETEFPPGNITIFNGSGKVVGKLRCSGDSRGNLVWKTGTVPSGIYFIEMDNGTERLTGRIAVSK